MRVGFTGTRYGMNDIQFSAFAKAITSLSPTEFHHGDCRGADTQAHIFVRATWPACWITIFPIDSPDWQFGNVADVKMRIKKPLARNKDIVNASEILIATPNTEDEMLRSGTWSTIRYARTKGKAVLLVHPDGKILREYVSRV